MGGSLMKQRVLIVFPVEWASYSPTLINLVNALEDDFDVRVLAFDNGQYKNSQLPARNYSFIWMPPGLIRVFDTLQLYKALRAVLLLIRLLREKADHVIGVDSVGLWAAQLRFGRAHFLSLEAKRDYLFRLCRRTRIMSVIIQTTERYEFLFGQRSLHPLRTFLIQNAPVLTASGVLRHPEERHLIYFGNIIPEHGIFQCLEVMRILPEMKLTVKGIMSAEISEEIRQRFPDLISSGRVDLDPDYLPQEEVVSYLSRFSAGFCFYDFNLIKKNDFNYLSAPSGKLFNYYAAGVPVIGSDILGLQSVRDYATGVLLQELTPETIANGVRDVLKRHASMRKACAVAAREFDFGVRVQPFVEFLHNS